MLGAIYQRSLRLGDILLPLMHELADQTGESVSFYSRHGDVRVCLHRVDSKHAVRDHVREGDVLPLDRGSGGRILRAFSGAKGEPYEMIRREHSYASVGERDAETAGISVPIFGGVNSLSARSPWPAHVHVSMRLSSPTLGRNFYASRLAPPVRSVAMLRQSKGRLRQSWQASAVAYVFPNQHDELKLLTEFFSSDGAPIPCSFQIETPESDFRAFGVLP